jgi:4-amino-4-deoxy-L-arabinose transferase-like glycosyltransferase
MRVNPHTPQATNQIRSRAQFDQSGVSDIGQDEVANDSTTHAPSAGGPARPHIPYLLFAVCAGLYVLPFMRILLQNTDEGILVYGAVRIVHGQVFARDFFEVVGPGTFYWLALFFKLFGVTFLTARACLFVTSLGTALTMYFLSRRICGRYQTLPCILLAGTYFGSSWPGVSHHVDSNCFALLSIACMTAWQDRHTDGLLFAAGALAGATACFLQPEGLLLLAALLVWLWMQRRLKSTSLSSLRVLAGGYVSVVGFILVYFWSQHALWDLIYANVVWPSGHYRAVNVVPYAQGILRDYWDDFVIGKGTSCLAIVAAAVLITPFFLVAVLPALLPVLGARHRKKTARPEIVLYWLCGWALWLAEIHRKDIYHLVFGSPLLVILCIYYLEQYRAKVAGLALQILAISAACLAGFNLFLVLSARPTTTRVGSVAVFKHVPLLTLLDDKVAPGEEIYAYPYCPMYYFLSATTNPTRYAALVYNFNTSSQFEEAIRVLEQRRIRYVVWDTNFAAKTVPAAFPASARMPLGGLIIEPYLESHYKLVKEDDGVRLLERKDKGQADQQGGAIGLTR